MPGDPEPVRPALLARLAQAASRIEIEEARALAEAWLRHHPDDLEVAADAARLAGLAEALAELGLDELPPSSGAR